MRAKIQYTDCGGDAKKVYSIFYKNNITIIKEEPSSVHPTITIEVDNQEYAYKLISALNESTFYGVKLLKIYTPFREKFWNLFFMGLK